jgi:hypothetical protein
MQAKSKVNTANIIGGIGAILASTPMIIMLAGGNSSYRPVALGGVLLLLGLPIYISAGKNAKTAVDIYNTNHRSITLNRNYDLQFGLNANGLSLKLNF